MNLRCKLVSFIANTKKAPEYTKLTYLGFDGNSWIDTGIYANNNTKIETTYLPKSLEKALYGVAEANKNVTAYISDRGSWRFGSESIVWVSNTDVLYHSVQNKEGVTINGATNSYSAQSDFVSGYTVLIGKQNLKTFSLFVGNIYGFKIYENDDIALDLIPVLDKHGEPCMYDLVNEAFYYNQGTGQFTYG